MPSSPDYRRNYQQEARTAKARGEIGGHDSAHSERLRLRRKAMKLGMVKPHDGKDVDHKVPVSKGGSNSIGNARVETAHDNRSFPRRPDGSMIANHPKN
jgi:hypothetical protein